MPKEDKLPLPSRKGRTQPDMVGEDSSIYSRLSDLAGQEDEGMMGGGGEEQAAQLLMSGANQLLQAARMHPALEPMVMQALSVIRDGVGRMSMGAPTGGEGMMPGGEGVPRQRKRTRPPREEQAVGEELYP